MKYAVTGATGRFGKNAIKHLLDLVSTEDTVVAIGRNVDKMKAILPNNVEIRQGDYDDEDTMIDALRNIDKLLFVSSQPNGKISRDQQHTNVINAAIKSKVKYIAYTSFPHANLATTPLAKDHQITEELILNSNMEYSFLRNNWYLENEMNLFNESNFKYCSADGHVGWALEREYSEAAARVLVMQNPKRIYEFAGKARTYKDLSDEISVAFNKKVKAINVSEKEYQEYLQEKGLDEATISLFTLFQTLIKEKQLEEDTQDLPQVLGHKLEDLPSAIREIVNDK